VTHKLLLADDSVTIQRVVELTFSGEDMQVISVGDGEQAIARIPLERPDIVLADIGMPKRSGYDVAAFVKGRPDLAHIPVLLLAGAFEPVDDARAQQVKCDGVLVKPFEPQQVVSRVRELVDGARARSTNVIAMPAPQPVVAVQAEKSDPFPSSPPEPDFQRKSESKLDDYFQGLDAALAVLDSKADSRAPMPPEMDDFRAADVPTLEKLLGSTPLRDTSGPAEPSFAATAMGASVLDALGGHARVTDAAPAPPPGGGGNVILDAFNALLAMEQGEPRPPARGAAGAPVVVTDELVDEVARRVIERLAPNTARELVRQIVADVAERLIRDEIARIQAAANTKR
jgi:CheY-like chemotaxis protein